MSVVWKRHTCLQRQFSTDNAKNLSSHQTIGNLDTNLLGSPLRSKIFFYFFVLFSGKDDKGGLEAAIIHPQMEVFGEELYIGVIEKAAILGFTLISNHPFLDGNKRIGHAAMEIFSLLNGFEIQAKVDEQEEIIIAVASCKIDKEVFTKWLSNHVVELNQ